MINQGEIRIVDELGRVVIPVEIRDILGIGKKTPLLVCRKGHYIKIKKLQNNMERIEGIKRKADELGRIVIPIGMRRATGMIEGKGVTIELRGSEIIMQLYQDSCIFCGKQEKLTKFENRLICNKCINKIKKLSEE